MSVCILACTSLLSHTATEHRTAPCRDCSPRPPSYRAALQLLGQSEGEADDELLSVAVLKGGSKVVCGSTSGVLNIWSWGYWNDCSDRFPGEGRCRGGCDGGLGTDGGLRTGRFRGVPCRESVGLGLLPSPSLPTAHQHRPPRVGDRGAAV